MLDWKEYNENDEHNNVCNEYATLKRFWDIIDTTQKKIWFNIDPCLGIPEEDETDDNKNIPGSF